MPFQSGEIACALAQIFTTCAGIILMAGYPRLAGRLLLAALVLALYAALGSAAPQGAPAMRHDWVMLPFPGSITVWVAVGSVIALILGMTRLARLLAIGPLFDWVALPLAWTMLPNVPLWVLLPGLVLLGFLALHGAVSSLFGNETAGAVTGTYVVRLLDALARIPVAIVRRIVRGPHR